MNCLVNSNLFILRSFERCRSSCNKKLNQNLYSSWNNKDYGEKIAEPELWEDQPYPLLNFNAVRKTAKSLNLN